MKFHFYIIFVRNFIIKTPKFISPPTQWQDFETLCKNLWGEIWQCPDIKKNGRIGQIQNGVDIYGIPNGEKHYYGIQCKGKDAYQNKQVTTKEIDNEIKKALEFKPPLKKLIFATTALKDSKIEEYIRELNLKHISSDLFQINIYSWEDIVDLLYANKYTYNSYVNSINYQNIQCIKITINGQENRLQESIEFQKITRIYRHKSILANNFEPLFKLANQLKIPQLDEFRKANEEYKRKINKSLLPIEFKFTNEGEEMIELAKLTIEFSGDIIEVLKSNLVYPQKSNKDHLDFSILYRNLFNENKSEKIEDNKITFSINKLVSGDSIVSEKYYIKPLINELSVIEVKWMMLSKEFKQNGTFEISIAQNIIKEREIYFIEDSENERIEEDSSIIEILTELDK